MLPGLFNYWNSKINVISRKDIAEIEIRHILHSLSIAKFFSFNNNSKIIFLGDTAQLPPVKQEISAALNSDFINNTYKLKCLESTLSQVVRQSNNSGILVNATEIRKNIFNNIKFENSHSEDYDFLNKAKKYNYLILISNNIKYFVKSDLNDFEDFQLNYGDKFKIFLNNINPYLYLYFFKLIE